MDVRPENLVARAKEHFELRDYYGCVHLEVGAMGEAIDQHSTVLSLGPTFHDLRCRLARMLLEVGRSLESLEELKTLAAAKSDASNIHSTLGLAHYVSGETGRAEENLDQDPRATPRRQSSASLPGHVRAGV